jgi:hypothetical protein
MSIRRHNARRDANESRIIAALEAMGCIVHRMDTPCDLLIWHRGTVYLAEVKTRTGRLTRDQQLFMENWPVTILRSVDDAIAFAGGKVAA